jgi:hypothetical protein
LHISLFFPSFWRSYRDIQLYPFPFNIPRLYKDPPQPAGPWTGPASADPSRTDLGRSKHIKLPVIRTVQTVAQQQATTHTFQNHPQRQQSRQERRSATALTRRLRRQRQQQRRTPSEVPLPRSPSEVLSLPPASVPLPPSPVEGPQAQQRDQLDEFFEHLSSTYQGAGNSQQLTPAASPERPATPVQPPTQPITQPLTMSLYPPALGVVAMPLPGDTAAPEWNGKAKNLIEFIRRFEAAANRANLSDDQKCEYLGRYCNKEENQRILESLNGFQNKNWRQYKKSIMDYYPEVDPDSLYSIRAIEKLVEKSSKKSPFTKPESFTKYTRKFLQQASWLEKENLLSAAEKGRLYLKGFPKKTRKAIEKRLEITDANHDPKKDYTFVQLHQAAVHLAKKFLDMPVTPVTPVIPVALTVMIHPQTLKMKRRRRRRSRKLKQRAQQRTRQWRRSK